MNEKLLQVSLLLAAAAAFATGGLCMKLSEGLSRPMPSVGVFVLFAAGAGLQAIAMRHADLGPAYIFVLGAEAIFTLLLSVWVLNERCPPSRIAAVVMVVAGIAWLRAS